jgi:hypothetical protein
LSAAARAGPGLDAYILAAIVNYVFSYQVQNYA